MCSPQRLLGYYVTAYLDSCHTNFRDPLLFGLYYNGLASIVILYAIILSLVNDALEYIKFGRKYYEYAKRHLSFHVITYIKIFNSVFIYLKNNYIHSFVNQLDALTVLSDAYFLSGFNPMLFSILNYFSVI